MQTGLPEQLQTNSNQLDRLGMESPLPRKCRLRQLVSRLVEHSWDVDGTKGPQLLLTPEEEVAGELRHATERKPPCRLIYATVAVLSVRTRTSLPRRCPLRRLKARRTTSNSRQLICQRSWGPVHTPDTACPLYVAPQPVAEASVNHNMPGDLFQGHSCPKERRICPRAEGFAAGRCNLNPVSTAFPCPPRDSAMEPVLKRSHMEQTGRNFAAAAAICPRSLWEFQWDRRPAW